MSTEQGDVEAIREALESERDASVYVQAQAALDRLSAALERAERERDGVIAALQLVYTWKDGPSTRVANRALAALGEALKR